MKKALIIIDIQNDYFDGGAMTLYGADAAALNAKILLEKFREERLPVVHIRHIAIRPNATFFLPATVGSEIHKNFEPLHGERMIIKHYPNSFRETALNDYLRLNEITDLVICGMMTHTCVDSTVRAAKDLGFHCTVIADACATKDLWIDEQEVKAAEVQKSFLAALNYYYANIKTTEEFLKAKMEMV